MSATNHFDQAAFLKTCLQVMEVKPDFAKVGAELNLKPGTASKRYSRMIEKNMTDPKNLDYLNTCLRISKVKFDWNKIGAATNLKAGTASKRYSRLMAKASGSAGAAIANVTAPAITPQRVVKKRNAKTTNTSAKKRKSKISSSDSDSESSASQVSPPATKKVKARKVKAGSSDDDDDDEGSEDEEMHDNFTDAMESLDEF